MTIGPGHDPGPERLVPGHQGTESTLKRGHVKLAAQPDQTGDVVRREPAMELVDKPQLFLRERQGRLRRTRRRRDLRHQFCPSFAVGVAGGLCGSSGAAGISLSRNAGEKNSHISGDVINVREITSPVRSPTMPPSTPPSDIPMGATPKSTMRYVAFIRASTRLGVTTCRSVMTLTLSTPTFHP